MPVHPIGAARGVPWRRRPTIDTPSGLANFFHGNPSCPYPYTLSTAAPWRPYARRCRRGRRSFSVSHSTIRAWSCGSRWPNARLLRATEVHAPARLPTARSSPAQRIRYIGRLYCRACRARPPHVTAADDIFTISSAPRIAGYRDRACPRDSVSRAAPVCLPALGTNLIRTPATAGTARSSRRATRLHRSS